MIQQHFNILIIGWYCCFNRMPNNNLNLHHSFLKNSFIHLSFFSVLEQLSWKILIATCLNLSSFCEVQISVNLPGELNFSKLTFLITAKDAIKGERLQTFFFCFIIFFERFSIRNLGKKKNRTYSYFTFKIL